MHNPITRRAFMGGAAGVTGLAAMGGRAFAQPALPKSPVTLSIVDVAGNLALTQKAIENYRRAKPNLVSRITFTKAPAPELPSKIKAQQQANRVDMDLVLTGTDALSAGIDQRSEEHTSELQSQFHLVCRLLLEKKNKKNQYLDRSGDKLIHHLLFFSRLHLSVQESDRHSRKDGVAQVFVTLLRIAQVHLLQLFNERIHNVNLPSGANFPIYQLLHFLPVVISDDRRFFF